MKETKLYCDICRKECTDNSYHLNLSPDYDTKVLHRFTLQDLCFKCGPKLYELIRKFVEQEREVQE